MGAIIAGVCEPRMTAQDAARDFPFLNLDFGTLEWRPMPNQTQAAIAGQKYISLKTFRKNGVGVATPVWFGEEGEKLYVMTRGDMGKAKRIRNNPQVRVAPCTIRGTVTGAEFAATARVLPTEEHARARQMINRKYWMARLPLIWARTDTYFELTFS
jgi:PPOX class probable F420-dependent enzyme